MNVKLTIAYDGTPFHGWQIQPNAATVQGTLKKALETLTAGQKITLIGAGRTDSGVHALAQVANFKTVKLLSQAKWQAALNALLPAEIVVLKAEFVPDAFHARYSAVGKTYAYHIGFQKSPFLAKREWTLVRPLKFSAMEEALSLLKGRHDFSSFVASSAESDSKICRIRKAELEKTSFSCRIVLSGDRFLTHMVRNIVGTLVEVGLRKIKPGEMKTILEAKDRRCAGPAAPPHGLYLAEVKYPKNIYS